VNNRNCKALLIAGGLVQLTHDCTDGEAVTFLPSQFWTPVDCPDETRVQVYCGECAFHTMLGSP